MSQKTNNSVALFLFPWVGTIAVAIILFVFYALLTDKYISEVSSTNSSLLKKYTLNMNPIFVAASTEVSLGIKEYSSSDQAVISKKTKYSILVIMLLSFVIGPSFIIYSAGEFYKNKNFYVVTFSEFFSLNRVFLMCGLVFVAVPMVDGINSVIDGQKYYSQLQSTVSSSVESNSLSYDIQRISYEAVAFSLKNKDRVGKVGTFNIVSEKDGSKSLIQLKDLPYFEGMGDAKNVFIRNGSDTSLSIIGIGNLPGQDKAYKNTDGSVGKTQVRAVVSASGAIESFSDN